MDQSVTHKIRFVAVRGQPMGNLNPDYPQGRNHKLDWPDTSCVVSLPYPAAGQGWLEVTCKTCGRICLYATTGRADDPVSAEMPCLPLPEIREGSAK